MRNVFEAILELGDDESFVPRSGAGFEPTDAQMGTREKIEVLARRAELGLPLWHPLDRTASGMPTDE